MFRRSSPSVATPTSMGAIAVTEQHDRCFRCGRPTALGVSLCEHDNPGRIKGPSPTQVHGTIVFGIIGGFILFALLAGLAGSGIGPFRASVSGSATEQGGAVEVIVRVTNSGTRPAGASCRVSRGGVSGVGDAVFFTPPIPAGETRDFTQLLPAPRAGTAATSTLVVRCN